MPQSQIVFPQRPVDAGVREGASPVVHAPFAVGDEDVRRRVEAENENQHDGVNQVEAQREQQSNDDERALVGQPQPSARGGSGCGVRAEGAHAARWGWSPAEAVRLRGSRAAVVVHIGPGEEPARSSTNATAPHLAGEESRSDTGPSLSRRSASAEDVLGRLLLVRVELVPAPGFHEVQPSRETRALVLLGDAEVQGHARRPLVGVVVPQPSLEGVG